MSIYLAQLRKLNDDVSASQERLSRLLSGVDREVSNIYHTIERTTEIDEATAYSAMTKLQDALHRRRIVKDEMALLSPVRRLLADNLKDTEKKYRRAAALSDEIRRYVHIKIEDITGGFHNDKEV